MEVSCLHPMQQWVKLWKKFIILSASLDIQTPLLNGRDVVMTMKGFDTATTNKSLADFLSKNYALGNNEAFYNKLKSFGNMGALTDSLNKLTGRDMLSRFNFEDMTMMRELNFDMNEKLFHNKEQHFALAGSLNPMAFKGDNGSNARYSLFNKRDGNKSIGLGIAFTDVRSDDTHEDNDRHETSYYSDYALCLQV